MDPATYDALLALPDGVCAEILGGKLTMRPSPLPRHARTQCALGRTIGGPFDDDDGRGGPGGWWILPGIDLRLSEHDIVRPDIAGWRRERLPNPWDLRPIDVKPDWVCEVTSPTSASIDRVLKRRLYAAHGVASYWIVDPEARTLEALQLDVTTWVEVGSFGDEQSARIAPFDAVFIEVGRFFPPRVDESR